MSLLNEVSEIFYNSDLNIDDRIKTVRNMILFILNVEINFDEYDNKRKDAIIYEQARGKNVGKKLKEWVRRAELSRYYLSYLHRGLIYFLKTGNAEEASEMFKCGNDDIWFCYDVLKSTNILEKTIDEIKDIEVEPIFVSDASIQYILSKCSYTINVCMKKVLFLTSNDVVDEHIYKSDLELWALRIIYLKEGMTDMVYLINIVNQSVTNHNNNLIRYYTRNKRQGTNGLIRNKEGANGNVDAEYTKVNVPLSEVEETLSTKIQLNKYKEILNYINESSLEQDTKKKINDYFSIIAGNKNKGYEDWLKQSGKEKELEEIKGKTQLDKENEIIDKENAFAKEYLNINDDISNIMKNAYEIVLGRNIPNRKYLDKVFIKKIQSITNINDKAKSYLIAMKCKMYSEEFISFLKLNGTSIVALDEAMLERMLGAFYGKKNFTPQETMTINKYYKG